MTKTHKHPVSEKSFKLGVVEGFFGSAWSWQARTDYADFLSTHGFNTYLYAPKSDHFLRRDWHMPFPQDHLDKLSKLADAYKNKSLNFGIGLSPFELYKDFNAKQKNLLRHKLEQINHINPSILCILFDDMQGDVEKLATQQTDITNFIIQYSQASHFIFCPTYYSDDPKLVSHFGKKPDHYFKDIGNFLDPSIDIFWTGPNVFSETFQQQHLQNVAERFLRKPLIWDNYPVNDAERLCSKLNLQAFPDQANILRKYTAGHLANPMNQAYLSQIPLFTLGQHYLQKSSPDLLKEACETLCPGLLGKYILEDALLFQQQGLSAMNGDTKAALIKKYSHFSDQPQAVEIVSWLKGDFAFDPACLT